MEHEKLAALRAQEKEGRDPTCADETMEYMLNTAEELGAEHILEIGAGKGLTSIAFALARPQARITAIERDAALGDAAEVLPCLQGPFDPIFLDAAKVW